MFTKTAEWYDALYGFKDYQKESDNILSLLTKEHPSATTVLDVACGTGEHGRYLSKHYVLDGLDISRDFVNIAEAKNPQGQYFCADMTHFDLQKKYDVVMCLFSSIGYVQTRDNLEKSLTCFVQHLNPGGIILVEPWFTPETWRPDGTVHLLTTETDDGKICRMNISETEGKLSVILFHYLVGTSAGVEHHTECHKLGLFTKNEMLKAFTGAELQVRYDEEGLMGRGLYIARAA